MSRVRIRYPYLQLVNLLGTEVFVTRPLRFPLSANYISLFYFYFPLKCPTPNYLIAKCALRPCKKGFLFKFCTTYCPSLFIKLLVFSGRFDVLMTRINNFEANTMSCKDCK